MRAISVKKRSRKSEQDAAAEIGGRVQPASGALPGMKGDVQSRDFLLEDKFTDAASYSLSRTVLDKIEHEAFRAMRKPLLRVTIKGKTYYVMPLRTFNFIRTTASHESVKTS